MIFYKYDWFLLVRYNFLGDGNIFVLKIYSLCNTLLYIKWKAKITSNNVIVCIVKRNTPTKW